MEVLPSRARVHKRQHVGRLDGGFLILGTLMRATGKQTFFSFLKALGTGVAEMAESKMAKKTNPEPLPRYQDRNDWQRSAPYPYERDPYASASHYPRTTQSSERFPGL